jgi:hypothetical protein
VEKKALRRLTGIALAAMHNDLNEMFVGLTKAGLTDLAGKILLLRDAMDATLTELANPKT